jgi:hypothetical protein
MDLFDVQKDARRTLTLLEMTKQLQLKLSVIAGILGKETLKDMGFEKRNDFILKQFENMKLNT